MSEQQEVRVNAKERFTKLDSKRDQVLQRARDCADLTIPALLPPEGTDENSNLPTPYQSLGSRAVNNLTSKLRLALFPPGNPFFRFKLDSDTADELSNRNPKVKSQIDTAMMKLEAKALDELEQGTDSVTLHAAIKQLVSVGNCLLHFPRDDASRIFRLPHYVILRDAAGNWYEIVAKETLNRHTLPEEVLALIATDKDDDEDVTIYTHIKKVGKKAEWYQEINEKVIRIAPSFPCVGQHWTTRTTGAVMSRNISATCGHSKTSRSRSCSSARLRLRSSSSTAPTPRPTSKQSNRLSLASS
jgi:hypothetical protein